jgi:hypothetical protein
MYNQFMMKRGGRIVTDFPWESTKLPQPWKHDYRRVVIPFTADGMKSARPNGKSAHVQIVKKSALTPFDAPQLVALKSARK